MKLHSRKWFKKRIGKRIYRDSSTCTCNHCKNVEENGLIIHDKIHAGYLYCTQCDFASEGVFLNYRDKK